MIIKFEKTHLFFALFVILGILYTVNIFNINKVSAVLVDKPVKLSFIMVVPGEEKCGECFDAQGVIDIIRASHNTKMSVKKIINPENLAYSNIIKTYKIKNLPALLISGDIDDKRILGAWKSFGGEKTKNKIVIQNLLPFYDITEGKIKGLIDAVLLKDDTCADCLDEKEYLSMIERRGMIIGDSITYDISSQEGSSLVEQYKITKIPTLILSSDARDYVGFVESWKQEVGTEEKDGRFVLREVQKIVNGLKFKEI